jgi:hypothetical protein
MLDGPADSGEEPDAFGPDPPPQSCNGDPFGEQTSECMAPPPVCADSRFAVTYGFWGTCVSPGTCVWTKEDVDCSEFEGGTCVGGDRDGGIITSDAGTLETIVAGCLVPARTPPATACDEDAGTDAETCSPPHPTCLTGDVLLSYDGTCVGGQCRWTPQMYRCPEGCLGSGSCVVPVH